MRQQAAGTVVAAWQHAAEASGCESVQCVGKFHAGFVKSSAQVLGQKQAS